MAKGLPRAVAPSSATHSYPLSDNHSAREVLHMFLLLQRVIVCYSGEEAGGGCMDYSSLYVWGQTAETLELSY